MGCKGIKSELNSTLFDCYVRNQIKPRLIMTYNYIYQKYILILKMIEVKIEI